MSSSPVPLKTHRVGQRCMLTLSRAETSSRCLVAAVAYRSRSPNRCFMSLSLVSLKYPLCTMHVKTVRAQGHPIGVV
ncbi:hypothetical protein TNCV_1011371 [Trichonephila clavipes]|uniref:Uncharacterized protein n=1 Tax=Trichonephila clavipes TaxID=2585209 RepID=A0A8X6VX80_TRICX|nr:hypothetical protein TNCV_1011371 [Trichonephila clavipes]